MSTALISTHVTLGRWWRRFQTVLHDSNRSDGQVRNELRSWPFFEDAPWQPFATRNGGSSKPKGRTATAGSDDDNTTTGSTAAPRTAVVAVSNEVQTLKAENEELRKMKTELLERMQTILAAAEKSKARQARKQREAVAAATAAAAAAARPQPLDEQKLANLLALDEQHRRKISELMADANSLQRELQSKNETVQYQISQIERLTAQSNSHESAIASAQLNLRDVEAQAARVQRLESEVGKLNDLNRQLRETVASTTSELKLKDEEIRVRVSEGSKWSSTTQTLESEKNTYERLLKERYDDIKSLQTSERNLLEQVKIFESRAIQWKSREDELVRDLNTIRKQLNSSQEETTSLMADRTRLRNTAEQTEDRARGLEKMNREAGDRILQLDGTINAQANEIRHWKATANQLQNEKTQIEIDAKLVRDRVADLEQDIKVRAEREQQVSINATNDIRILKKKLDSARKELQTSIEQTQKLNAESEEWRRKLNAELDLTRVRAQNAEADVVALSANVKDRDEQHRISIQRITQLEEEATAAAVRRKDYRKTIELQKARIVLLGSALTTVKTLSLQKIAQHRAAYDAFRTEIATSLNRFNQMNREKVAADLQTFTQVIANQQSVIKNLQSRLARVDDQHSAIVKQLNTQITTVTSQVTNLTSQIHDFQSIVARQDENIAFKTRELENTKKKSASRKGRMEELKKKITQLMADIEMIRTEREREQKHYEAMLRSKTDHIKAYGTIVQTSIDGAVPVDPKKSKSSKSTAPTAGGTAAAGGRQLPSHLIPGDERSRDAEIARLKEQIRLQQSTSSTVRTGHHIKYDSHIQSSYAAGGGAHPIPEIVSVPYGLRAAVSSGTIPANVNLSDLQKLLVR